MEVCHGSKREIEKTRLDIALEFSHSHRRDHAGGSKHPGAYASLFGQALSLQKTVGPGVGAEEITLHNAREKFIERINRIAQRMGNFS